MKSQETRRTMGGNLQQFLVDVCQDILDGDINQRAEQFVNIARKDQQRAVQIILAYTKMLKSRTTLAKNDKDYLNPSSIPNKIKPIKKLLDMSGVGLGWKRIYCTYPEEDNTHKGRGYTREEINTILKFTNPLERAVTLIASSSGMRRAGFEFTWDCIKPVYRRDGNIVMGNYDDEDDSGIVCGMITVYAGSTEQYFALFTPEAWESIKTYKIQWRSDVLKNPRPDDPFLKRTGNTVSVLSCDAMANRMNKVLKKAKIREPLKAGKRNYEVPIMNGFRRYFNKINKEVLSKDSPLAALIKKEMMLSHTGLIKLDKNYFKTQWKELVEEYVEAVPALTISSEERVKAENKTLRKENSDLGVTRQELEDMQKEIRLLKKYRKREKTKDD
jgi:hypothetical protein